MSFTIKIHWKERNEDFSVSIDRKRTSTISDLEQLIRSNSKKFLSSSDEITLTIDGVKLSKVQLISRYNIKSSTLITMSTAVHHAAHAIEGSKRPSIRTSPLEVRGTRMRRGQPIAASPLAKKKRTKSVPDKKSTGKHVPVPVVSHSLEDHHIHEVFGIDDGSTNHQEINDDLIKDDREANHITSLSPERAFLDALEPSPSLNSLDSSLLQISTESSPDHPIYRPMSEGSIQLMSPPCTVPYRTSSETDLQSHSLVFRRQFSKEATQFETPPSSPEYDPIQHELTNDAFTSVAADIVLNASADPISLAYRLHDRGLLPKAVKVDVSSPGVRNTQKMSWILHEIEINLRTTRKPKVILKEFCEILYQYPSLKGFVTKMEKKMKCPLGRIQSFSPTYRRQGTPNDLESRSRILSRQGCRYCQIQENEKKYIVRRAWDAITKWYAFGYELDISVTELDDIRNKYTEDHERFINIVELWFRSTSTSSTMRPTWYRLAHILMRPLGFKSIAIEILKEYCSDCCYKQID